MKRSPLKRRPPRHKPAEQLMRELWRTGLGPCQVCPQEGRVCEGRVDAHHVIPRRSLRSRGLNAYLYDRRNRMAVCRFRHEEHESRFRPIPRELLPASVFVFAAELELGYLLERYYPVAA